MVQNCIACFKNKPKNLEQIMGNLPREIITPSSPFTHVGIDFTGPFYIKYKGKRKGIYNKCYVANFICFITKAIHTEVVTELTTEAMIATLNQFFSRRGKNILANYLTNEEITWKFIPPRSPNFRGLWEAGVKSFKNQFKRTVGGARLTLEQFITITTEIESILNSRPLTPMSSDPNDFVVLSPGHFLIGRPLQSLPESDMTDKLDNRLSQWQKLTKFVQFIWREWRLDYLNNLQARHKWQFEKENATPNSMVILKDENLPPCKWIMGRTLEVVKGSDGKVRVVKVKTLQAGVDLTHRLTAETHVDALIVHITSLRWIEDCNVNCHKRSGSCRCSKECINRRI
ncbi:integrase catalytic domain-containing protein [Trichonephila clavipes]|nr:integrase catalytic domain-containing protein [Trichonephila clavipes]